MIVKFNSVDLPANFVSIATKIEGRKATHAGILIRHCNIHYLHHFPGNTRPVVEENFNEDGWYVYKVLDAFNVNDEKEVASFLQVCKRICLKSNITYSYIADGSHYDNRGEFIARIGLPEFGTCVGFCVNTLKDSIIDVADRGYFNLEEWDDSGLNERYDAWAQNQVASRYPDLDWELYKMFKKRIAPIEYLCSAFTKDYPITKDTINELRADVEAEIEKLFPVEV